MSGTGIYINPPRPVRVPPDLDGLAWFVIDYGPGHHKVWTVQLLEGSNVGCSWDFPNPSIRFNTSISDGWTDLRPFTPKECKQYAFLLERRPRRPRNARKA